MWHVMVGVRKQKLSKGQQRALRSAFDGMSFSCGSPLEDLDVADC